MLMLKKIQLLSFGVGEALTATTRRIDARGREGAQ